MTLQQTTRLPRPWSSPPPIVRDRVEPRFLAVALITSAVVVAGASAVAIDGNVPAWEVRALEFVNGWPDQLKPVVWVLQQVGVTGAPIIAGVLMALWTRRAYYFIPFALVLPFKLVIEKGIVKQLVERERPFTSVGDSVNVRGPAFEGLSFPSGHTTTAFGIAIVLMAFMPRRWQWLPPAWAAIVAISRLYYGEHNLLDVVAGAALGSSFGLVIWYFLLNRCVDQK